MKKYSNENVFLNSINDLTRQAYTSDARNVPLNNAKSITRFESDIFINKKEEFETNNSKINSLNDEIRELKSKLKLVTEKDKKIYELEIIIEKNKKEIEELKTNIIELKRYEKMNIQLKKENENYQIEQMNIESVKVRNELLTKKVIELSQKIEEISKDKILKEDMINSDMNNSDMNNDDINSDKIKVDIDKIKHILSTRLKSYQEEHIYKLMEEYELSKKEFISKKDMTELLNRAIHI